MKKKHSNKEEEQKIVATYFAKRYFGGQKCEIRVLAEENDSVDVEIGTNIKAQVVTTGASKDSFWRTAKHFKKSEPLELGDVESVTEILSVIKKKLKKEYSDVDDLILLIGCWMANNAFENICSDLQNIKKQIAAICGLKRCFKEIWAIKLVAENDKIIKLWP